MKFEWEHILVEDYSITTRAKVFGGWIVKYQYESSDDFDSISMVFVPDANHEWEQPDPIHGWEIND